MRLDSFIFSKFNLKSRTYAVRVIKNGQVTVNDKICTTPSKEILNESKVELNILNDFASFGGEKLQKALDNFKIKIENKTCIDIGCSNGGFTDCLLKLNAKSILAIDVGDCALPQEILNNKKVKFLKCNARFLTEEIGQFDFLCLDCSFISLKLLLQSVYNVLKNNGEAVLLFKPQFEVGKKYLSKKGIATDLKAIKVAQNEIINEANTIGLKFIEIISSPKKEADKNQEYLLYFKKP